MRYRISLLLILSTFCIAEAQIERPLGYFWKTSDNHVIWQCVYNSSISRQEVEQRLRIEGFRILDSYDNLVAFYCDNLHVNPKDYGYSIGETPMFVTGRDLIFRGFVQIKEGRYRVTLDRMAFVDNITTAGGVFIRGEITLFEVNALDGDEFSRVFQKIPARIYNTCLYKIFLLGDPENTDYLNHEW